MLVTAKIKLLPTDGQFQLLQETMKQFNLACNAISEIMFEKKVFSKVAIQQLCYYEIREKFEALSSQLVIRAIAKVAEAYNANKKVKCTFRLDGAIVYDQRILSLKGLESASLTTVAGRILVPMVVSDYHLSVIQDKRVRGQADLVLVDGVFYLLLVIEIPEGMKINATDVLALT